MWLWLYFRFCLSDRDVAELMAERGVILTYEAVRYWCRKFGQVYANPLRRRGPRPGDTWHPDEVFLTSNGRPQSLWRVVDQEGHILDVPVQPRRDKTGAKTFLRVMVTDQLRSDRAALREILPHVERRQHRSLNNRVENSHQLSRQRGRRLQRFKSPGHAQRFLAAYGPIAQHFRLRRHRVRAAAYRQEPQQRFDPWQELTNVPTAAQGVKSEAIIPLLTRSSRCHAIN